MHILRMYAHKVALPACHRELRNASNRYRRAAKKLLLREQLLLDSDARQRLRALLAASPTLRTVYEFRERLKTLWAGTHASNEALVRRLSNWIDDAESSGLPMLREYALQMRSIGLPAR